MRIRRSASDVFAFSEGMISVSPGHTAAAAWRALRDAAAAGAASVSNAYCAIVRSRSPDSRGDPGPRRIALDPELTTWAGTADT